MKKLGSKFEKLESGTQVVTDEIGGLDVRPMIRPAGTSDQGAMGGMKSVESGGEVDVSKTDTHVSPRSRTIVHVPTSSAIGDPQLS